MTSASGRIAWVDASAGASGDMLLGAVHDALVALDLDPGVMARAAATVGPVDITVEHEQRVGFHVARANVTAAETRSPHRSWRDVRRLIGGAELDAPTRAMALEVFARLAMAEGHVHGVSSEEVHFHEVGALDAIGDIVGVCAGIVALDLAALYVSPIALGGGSARTSHGEIPIPGPAVLELLRRGTISGYGGPVEEELCTPTGAALLTTIGKGTPAMPGMTVLATGLGAGTRHTGVGISALRLVVGRPAKVVNRGRDIVIESNVDDLDPRLWPAVLNRLMEAGASDAWLTPILMKKGRPAHTLHVLAGPNAVLQQHIRNIILTETSAIGLRESEVEKTALDRRELSVDVDGQAVRVKVALDGMGHVVNVQPEYDDIAAAASALDRPAKTVLAQAVSLAQTASLDV